jgi:hypothetical protein
MSSVTLNNQRLTPSNALVMVVRACMGFGSAAGVGGQSGFRSDSKRKYATAAHLWERYPANLAAVCQRLQGVIIENKDALAVMRATTQKRRCITSIAVYAGNTSAKKSLLQP